MSEEEDLQMCPRCGELQEWDSFDDELLICRECVNEIKKEENNEL